MVAHWLAKGEIFNSWKETCSREEMGRKSWWWKKLKLLLFVYAKHKKVQNKVGFRWECLHISM